MDLHLFLREEEYLLILQENSSHLIFIYTISELFDIQLEDLTPELIEEYTRPTQILSSMGISVVEDLQSIPLFLIEDRMVRELTEEEYFDILETLPKENQYLDDDDPEKFIAKMGAEALYDCKAVQVYQ